MSAIINKLGENKIEEMGFEKKGRQLERTECTLQRGVREKSKKSSGRSGEESSDHIGLEFDSLLLPPV